jgi:Polyketide cyclase / dehydrase and lipid transport
LARAQGPLGPHSRRGTNPSHVCMTLRTLLCIFGGFGSGLLSALTTHGASAGAWILDANREGVVIYSRPHADTGLKEFKGIGEVAAAPSTVFAVLNNTIEYPRFMPYSAEVRILRRSSNSVVAYHRIKLPLLRDRDYILRSVRSATPSPAGAVYHISWNPVNGIGPPPQPGVQRITTCEGSWLLEPTGKGTTRATYNIYSDTGGAIPAFLANGGCRVAIRKIFAAVRKEALDPKYGLSKG